MALLSINFSEIAALAADALATYGTAATFTEEGAATGRPIKVVLYQDKTSEELIQDADSVPAQVLLSPADFVLPNRTPQKFDIINMSTPYSGIWTLISEPHPVFAGDLLAIYIGEVRRN